ncbi:MAG: hypothetical protein IT355_20680 [Gemmatimonadaceae bacterium]|nr:hypothetical protein [Gemmatimonadaceae bacterium]
MVRKLLVSLAFSVVALSSAFAQGITGEWDASMNTPGGARQFRIQFLQDGEKLTGTVKRESGDAPLVGTVTGTAVKFAYTINYGGNPIVMTVTTTLAGNEMSGQVDIASQVQESFSAKKVVVPAKP